MNGKRVAYNNTGRKIIIATIKNVIVALLLALCLMIVAYGLTKNEFDQVASLLKTLSVNTQKKALDNIVFNKDEKTLKNYPEYGTQYGEISIESLDILLPLYYGDTLSILRNGAGQTAGTYFPGEGGTIVCMAHNSSNMFRRLPEIQMGEKIVINTSYGKFTYEVYDTKIINMYDVDAIELQNEEERLAVYTCYPVTGIGNKTDRFVAFAKLVNMEL